MKSPAYYLGMVVGIAVAVGIIWIALKLSRSTGRMKPEYDERQKIARGEAFRAGFIALAAFMGLYALLESFEVRWAEPDVAMFLGLLAGAGAFVVSAIRRDAYFGMNENFRGSVTLLGVLGGMNLLLGGVLLVTREKKLIENGLLQPVALNLAVGLLLLVILAASALHHRRQEAAMEEEDA